MSERAPDYAQGFKDGFAAGLEEGKKLAPKQTRLDDYVFGQPKPPYFPQYDPRETCPKCGIKISGVMGYVCSSINCPVQYQVTSDFKPMTGVVGAVGSEVSYTHGHGANGPDEKQYDDRGWRIK